MRRQKLGLPSLSKVKNGQLRAQKKIGLPSLKQLSGNPYHSFRVLLFYFQIFFSDLFLFRCF
jgi:hypothetical protein